jgi:anti-sigma regulatory factor (Ser/Thr protein kinase)
MSPEGASGGSAEAHHTFLVAGGYGAPRACRQLVRRQAERHIDSTGCEELELLVSEVATNAVRHGGADDGQAIGVELWLEPGRAWVEVSDPGLGFTLRSSTAAGATAGNGLTLLERLSRTWGVSRGDRFRVWFEYVSAREVP